MPGRREELFQHLKRSSPFWLPEVLDLMLAERGQALDEVLFVLRQRNVDRNDHGLAEAIGLVEEMRSFVYLSQHGTEIPICHEEARSRCPVLAKHR